MATFLQINTNRCREAQDLALHTMTEKGADVLCVSEPNRIPSQPGWVGSTDSKCALYLHQDTEVMRTGAGAGFAWAELRSLRIYSCYITPNCQIEDFLDFLNLLEYSIRSASGEVIISGDFNAHAQVWGSSGTNRRGEALLEMAESLNLLVMNDGKTPTFPRGNSFLDLTMATPGVSKKFGKWVVLEQETMSDHQYILFKLNGTDRRPTAKRHGWAWRKLDRNKLDIFILGARAPTATNAEENAAQCSELLAAACNNCMPKGIYKGGKKPCHWWSTAISNLRKECMHARRMLRRGRHRNEDCSQKLNEYRELKKKLKVEIRKSKEKSWRDLCKQVEVDPWGIPFKLVTKNLVGRRPITGLTIPGRLELIVDTLFPSQQAPEWFTMAETEEFPWITDVELKQIGSSLPQNKAPGPDGIPDAIVKHIIGAKPELIIGTLNKCLQEGHFPTAWKEAKLVLLQKGNKPLEEPASYRPICLLNTVGKLLERVIKKRLEDHLEEAGGMSDRQFGFTKGRSTVDAIMLAMEVVNKAGKGPLRKRKLCAMVSLDVANAFNTAAWAKIDDALVTKRVPMYLTRILRSYLSNRALLYGDNERRAVTCGVPQGSVLGPTLWNVMYDDLLQTEMPGNIQGVSSSTLIAFADDVAILATGRTTADLEEAMNSSLNVVAEWMTEMGLSLSVNKTEAIMLTTKRGYQTPRFFLENVQLQLKEQIRYLGIELSRKVGFGKHLECAAAKATKTICSLARLMPNIGGPKHKKRQLLMSVAQNQLLYAAPVWSSALVFQKNIQVISGPQRKMAIRITRAYKTVSTNAILVVAGILPLKLQAAEKYKTHELKRMGENPPSKRELRMESIREWQSEWEISETGRWTRRLIPDLKPWVTRGYGDTSYHITQFLTGHGCFGSYLFKFKKLDNPECYDCKAPMDDAEHAFFSCDRWWRQRRELEARIEAEFTPESAVNQMMENRNHWEAITSFITNVLSTREEEERRRQQQPA